MARQTSLRNFTPIIDAAGQWFRDTAIADGSLFSSDPLWTLELTVELRRAFVERPDFGGDNFINKLHGQLSDASPAARRLMGEMLWITLLFPSNVGAGKKRELITVIWNLGGTSLDPAHPLLSDAILEGIGSGGMGFNNHRWRELVFLITWVERFKQIPRAEREAVLGDYDRFLSFTATLPDQGYRQLRHMLRYFAFPDRVERMCSSGERRKVLAAFRQMPERELKKWDDRRLDDAMLSLRRELEAAHPDLTLDFYEPPLWEKWGKSEPEPEDPAPTDPTPTDPSPPAPANYWWMNFNPRYFDIEAKPDGHREPYTTHNDEGRPRNNQDAFEKVRPGDLVIGYSTTPRLRASVLCEITRSIHESDEGRAIEFKRVRPLDWPVPRSAMVSDSRLQNAAPFRTPQGSLFPLTNGQFEAIMELASEDHWQISGSKSAPLSTSITTHAPTTTPVSLPPYTEAHALADLFMSAEQLGEIRRQLIRKKNLVLQGPPGVGKTFAARRLAYLLLGEKDDTRVETVQFHPSTSYEDFVLGLRPDGNGGFALKPGVFHRFCQRARRHPASPHVFIIDEINRGNLAKIFGELLMLVEPDKRGPDHAVPLAYDQDGAPRFFLPENLFIIGTMNTADRSLALVDYALRRRFAFIGLAPNFGPRFRTDLIARGCPADFVAHVCERFEALNVQITADTRSLGPGYQIGHSYFCDAHPITEPAVWLRDIIRYEIKPLLEEYWMDDAKKAAAEVSKLAL